MRQGIIIVASKYQVLYKYTILYILQYKLNKNTQILFKNIWSALLFTK